ncbi:hypothetical protein K402DRAFT_327563 [Aulographum hederae CBS 113979]|uniref:Uncharacterized protein n=1 Tax=Aulographum hederae CBS 113979 TaxID=1176131 RepID=A0A6G1H797_9PEZI|nr:hypothetical protein K402DRAFT_327563 [Aulographum hederae CBS 113979]
MTSTGFQPSAWQWPDSMPKATEKPEQSDDQMDNPNEGPGIHDQAENLHDTTDGNTARPRTKTYPPRTCRICLETVQPTFHPPSEHIPTMFRPQGNVTYDSEEGRLLKPCKCKGTQKYVHEKCLESWRTSSAGSGSQNYYKCPTCRHSYRIERVKWGNWLRSTASQVGLTITILIFTIFLLGFFADPVLNTYYWFHGIDYVDIEDEEASTWGLHFANGLVSLGLLSFLKTFLSAPVRFFNFRIGGTGNAQVGNTGRDRLQNVSWLVVLIGVMTFLWAVWKGVRALTRRFLEGAAERVMDVDGEDPDDAENEQ